MTKTQLEKLVRRQAELKFDKQFINAVNELDNIRLLRGIRIYSSKRFADAALTDKSIETVNVSLVGNGSDNIFNNINKKLLEKVTNFNDVKEKWIKNEEDKIIQDMLENNKAILELQRMYEESNNEL